MDAQVRIVDCLIVGSISVRKNLSQHRGNLDIRELCADPRRVPERAKVGGRELAPSQKQRSVGLPAPQSAFKDLLVGMAW